MRIVYPYNEILPKKTAHDVYIFDECAALAHAGLEVTLLCGRGTLRNQALFHHYQTPHHAFHIKRLPILRKNNPLGLSWNAPFFFFSQRAIRHLQPDWVFLSVRKQAAYHLERKLPSIRYLYEVHELAYYPYMGKNSSQACALERQMLAQADCITVTTEALKHILLAPPYSLTVPIEVVPLAVKQEPLPPPPEQAAPLTLMYVGQLYAGQGLPTLISALALVEGIHLKILGGKEKEIRDLKQLAADLHVSHAVEFLGFISPSSLPEAVQTAHAFVAPFDQSGRMPYVAHTKLFEYAQWGRPIIAPDLPTVREHFSQGALLFEPENAKALADCMTALKAQALREHLQSEIHAYAGKFSWNARAQHYLKLLT